METAPPPIYLVDSLLLILTVGIVYFIRTSWHPASAIRPTAPKRFAKK